MQLTTLAKLIVFASIHGLVRYATTWEITDVGRKRTDSYMTCLFPAFLITWNSSYQQRGVGCGRACHVSRSQ